MIVEYSKDFKKAVDKLSGKQLSSVLSVIAEVKKAETVNDITDCKRLIGYKHIYRIRIGGLRAFFTLHIEIVGDTVRFEYLISLGQAYAKKTDTELKKLDR